MNNYGFDSCPSTREIKDSVYILLGASHLPLHPVSGKCKLIPRQLQERYPGLRLFISKIDGQKILAGCLVGKGGTLHNNIQTHTNTNTQITFSGEPGLDDDDDDSDEENDDETLMIGKTELDLEEIFFSGQVSEGRDLDGEIYF